MIRTLVLAFIASAVALGAQQARAQEGAGGPPTPPHAGDAAAPVAAQPAAPPAAPAVQPSGPASAEPEEPMSMGEAGPAPADGSIPGYVAGTDLFYGRVNAMPPTGFVGDWSIAGRIVRVSDQTKVEEQGEPITVGIRVEVIGVYREGYFDAMIVRNRRR